MSWIHDSTEIYYGPPGTGKTTTLVDIVREEMRAGVAPDRIAFITFTRRGAQEARDRMQEEFGLTGRSVLPWFSTIHSLCMRHLGGMSSTILDGAKLQEFADWIGEDITGRFSVDDGTYAGYGRGDRMLFMENMARVRRIPLRKQYEESHDDIDWAVLEKFSRALAEFKRNRGVVDYTDLLERFLQARSSPPLEVLIVDEAQDLSLIQWDIVRVLARGARRVAVAGDDDQGIFRWAGADVDTFVDLEGRARVLQQSWRVPHSVQSVALRVISRVARRRQKTWSPRPDVGSVSRIPDLQEADWSGSSVMVLARNQHTLRAVMSELRSSGVFYVHHGHTSIRPALLRAIVTWERLRAGEPQPGSEAARVYEFLGMGVGYRRGSKDRVGRLDEAPITMEKLRQDYGLLAQGIWHEALDRIPPTDRSYLVRCRRNGERFSQPPRVRVDTIHASKGGEAERVVIIPDMMPRTWQEYLTNRDDEARVWYVGCTRAKQELQIVRPVHRMAYDL